MTAIDEPPPAGPDRPYRGPDRRGVARFVVPAGIPTALLVGFAIVALLTGPHLVVHASSSVFVELRAVAATLALLGGIACLLRWRLDGIAMGWWCGWALLVIGVGQLSLEPVASPGTRAVELATYIVAVVLFGRAVGGPEVDATIHVGATVAMVAAGAAVATIPALVVGRSASAAGGALAIAGTAWLAVALAALLQARRGLQHPEAGWIVPVAVGFGLAEILPELLHHPGTALLADRSFELAATTLACVGALGGLVRAAVHHRTRALREHIDHEREVANRRRVEESFADRLHEMRSTVVAIEGGVETWTPELAASTDATLRAALIAEIRRLRTLVNESPAAAGVEAFDIESALMPTIALHRANGQVVTFECDGTCSALGRPAELAQVVHGLLTNAAKYAPASPVQIRVHHALDEVAIRVEDEGPGIDPVSWDQIFERGVRLEGSQAEGSGIGLCVGRRLIRSQDGDLWVEESPRGGAAFVISIPAAPALRVVAGRAETAPVMSASIQEAR